MAGLFLPLPFHQAFGLLAIGGIPASIVVAMARHRLFGTDRRDIDRLTSQTILCAAQVTAGVLVSGLALWALDTRLSLSSESAFLGAMVIVVATWSPLHRLIARAVERALSPMWAYHALITLGNRLESTIAPDDVVPALAETVSAALGLAYVAVEVGDDYGSAAAAVCGIVEDDVIVVPLVYQQEVVGRLTVGPHFGKQLEPTDLNLLHELAIQASPVLYAVRLTADLRQSKDRLVTAREEEWRRLRRELHDRLGPLSATRLGLKATWNHLTRGKLAVAQTRLEELDSLLAGEIDHIRRLGDRLRPRAVGELDLLSVLREKTALWALPPRLAVTLEADGLGSLPPGVAVAVYQIVVEAVTNARCHGHAQTCRVRLACDDGMVKLEVRDDGVGLGPSDREGDGICDMRERAVELGGTCSVQAASDRGTVVSAEIPLEVR
jgi:signal transduction histidine kinase